MVIWQASDGKAEGSYDGYRLVETLKAKSVCRSLKDGSLPTGNCIMIEKMQRFTGGVPRKGTTQAMGMRLDHESYLFALD